jgi:hypothetical protein
MFKTTVLSVFVCMSHFHPPESYSNYEFGFTKYFFILNVIREFLKNHVVSGPPGSHESVSMLKNAVLVFYLCSIQKCHAEVAQISIYALPHLMGAHVYYPRLQDSQ